VILVVRHGSNFVIVSAHAEASASTDLGCLWPDRQNFSLRYRLRPAVAWLFEPFVPSVERPHWVRQPNIIPGPIRPTTEPRLLVYLVGMASRASAFPQIASGHALLLVQPVLLRDSSVNMGRGNRPRRQHRAGRSAWRSRALAFWRQNRGVLHASPLSWLINQSAHPT